MAFVQIVINNKIYKIGCLDSEIDNIQEQGKKIAEKVTKFIDENPSFKPVSNEQIFLLLLLLLAEQQEEYTKSLKNNDNYFQVQDTNQAELEEHELIGRIQNKIADLENIIHDLNLFIKSL